MRELIYGQVFPPKDAISKRRAIFFANITNEVVFNRLVLDILPALKKVASKADKQSKSTHGEISEIGYPTLKKHLVSVITILKLSRDQREFKRNIDVVHPRVYDTIVIDFNEPSGES